MVPPAVPSCERSHFFEANCQQALPPHLPLLLLQTSSALSHIFPEIRLEACRLVRLLLSLCPDQVVGSWPYSSTSTILEGLRLAVGLGGKKGEGGQTGVSLLPASKLITLQAMLEFIQHALGSTDKVDTVFEGWLEPDPLVALRAIERHVVDDELEHGWLAGTGIGAWGLEPLGGAGEAAWEVGRLEGAGAAETGDQDDVDDVLCVGFYVATGLLTMLRACIWLCTRSSSLLSWSKLLLHSTFRKYHSLRLQQAKTHQSLFARLQLSFVLPSLGRSCLDRQHHSMPRCDPTCLTLFAE